MKLFTSQFGEIEIEEQGIVTFTAGFPGFEHLRQFIFLQPDLEIPFSFMQSIEEKDLTFVVTSPFGFYPDYVCDLADEVVAELQISTNEDVMIWSIVTIQDSIQEATLNLLAPIVVNKTTKNAKQVIINGSVYRTKHKLWVEPIADSADTIKGRGEPAMLVLSRKIGETIIIGDSIEITVLGIVGDSVRIGIQAPKEVAIHRQEVYLAIRQSNKEASQSKMALGTMNQWFVDKRK